ncbi:MAG: hypothetical protein V4714_17705 [Bacteroidota bacterium]
MKTESERLKDFMLNNFDFDGLKKAGFYRKEIKRKDYQTQADRICSRLGLTNIYQYNPPEIIDSTMGNVATAIFSSSVNEKGEYVKGDCGLISTTQSHFECPHCTCINEVNPNKNDKQKCKGCKRTLSVYVDMIGNAHVFEYQTKF